MVRNLDIDMTGFRAAVLVEGKASVRPLLQRCIIRWSLLSTPLRDPAAALQHGNCHAVEPPASVMYLAQLLAFP